MNTNEISGKRQLEFLADFDISERQELQEKKKQQKGFRKLWTVLAWRVILEEFSFDTFQIKKAKAESNRDQYTKEYTVTGYGKMRKHSRGRAGSTICVCRER